MYVIIWCFFWSTYFSSNNRLFFLPTFSTKFFFWFLWRQNIFFNFFLAPPPRYQIVNLCMPNAVGKRRDDNYCWVSEWAKVVTIAFFKALFFYIVRDAPLDIWGEGAYSFCCLQTFFYPWEKTIFFLAINVRQFFAKNFFVVYFPYYVRYNLVFFLVNIFFIKQPSFFSAHIFNEIFFLIFVTTKYFFNFFLAPPPPRYQIVNLCMPNAVGKRRDDNYCWPGQNGTRQSMIGLGQ